MAKSKSPKKIIGVAGTIGIAGVLIYLFVVPILLVTPNIAPEIPPEFEIPINVPIPVGLPDPNPDADFCLEESTGETCTENVDEGEIIIACEDVVPPNCMEVPPISSEDPPIEQIIDEIPEEEPVQIILPDPEVIENTVRLFSKVTKIDSDLVSTVIETGFDIPLAQLFVESASNRNFDSGSLVIEILGNTSATDLSLVGTAELDILIANQTVLIQPLQVSFSKTTDTGEVIGEFVSPTGQKSNDFAFFFADNLDKFPTQGTTELKITLNNVEITIDSRESFASSELNLLTMTIDTDPNLLLITNEQGDIERILPKDIGLTYHNLGSISIRSNGLQCGGYHVRDSGNIEIFNSEGTSLDSGRLKLGDTYGTACGRLYNVIQVTLDRDTEYRLVHTDTTDPSADFDITFKTPISQKNFGLRCYHGTASAGQGLAWYNCNYPSPDGSEILYAPPPL